ncbi:MAG TPA: hypothetical protein VMA72_12240 [Streptosporangiaceae bacterium]|nr:hypothetical protein [Streptosporangiaceae bacterium]
MTLRDASHKAGLLCQVWPPLNAGGTPRDPRARCGAVTRIGPVAGFVELVLVKAQRRAPAAPFSLRPGSCVRSALASGLLGRALHDWFA